MRTLLTVLLTVPFLLAACGEKKKAPEETTKAPAAAPMQPGENPPTMEPAKDPEPAAAPKFQMYEPLVKLIEATRSCKTVVHGDCAERKALEDWTSNAWMGKAELSKEDRIRAFKTAATLVLDKNEMVRNHAAGVFQLDPFKLHEELAKDPKLVEKAFVENLLKAMPELDTFRSGWLMERIPAFTPAYGLLEASFQAADKCKNKDDLYGRILKVFPKFSRIKHLDVTQKFAKDTTDKGLPLASQALAGLLEFTWEKDEAAKICPWVLTVLPEKLDAETAKRLAEGYFLFRWFDLADRCKVLDSKEHLEFNAKMVVLLEGMKALKLGSETYEKTYQDLRAHFTKMATQLKQ